MSNIAQDLLKGDNLLVVSPLDFAEACFSVPAIRALSQLENVQGVVVLSPSSLQEYWKLIDAVDEVIVYDEALKSRKIANLLAEQLKAFHVSLLWEVSEASKALVKVRVERRIGRAIKGLDKLLTDKLEISLEPSVIEHRVQYYLRVAEELGADVYLKENFQILDLSVKPEGLRIAVAEVSGYGEAYSWDVEVLAEVKNQVEKKHPQVEWVSISTKDSVLDLRSCTALLACDGEVAHWAACLGLPAVVVFGAGEPRWKRPLGKQSRVVREHVACSPCFLETCPFDHECQKSVNVGLIVSELENAMTERL